MLTGREEGLLSCLHSGGKGCMTATSGILPEIMAGIYSSFLSNEFEKASQLQNSLLPIIRAMMFDAPFPIGFKMALEVRGFPMGKPRVDLGVQEAEKTEKLRDRLKELLKKVTSK